MMEMYCRANHGRKADLCDECKGLYAYGMRRIEACPHGTNKPVCSKCPIHCYKQDMREKICAVMRFSGPRMMFVHPWLALLHALDGMRGKTRPRISSGS